MVKKKPFKVPEQLVPPCVVVVPSGEVSVPPTSYLSPVLSPPDSTRDPKAAEDSATTQDDGVTTQGSDTAGEKPPDGPHI